MAPDTYRFQLVNVGPIDIQGGSFNVLKVGPLAPARLTQISDTPGGTDPVPRQHVGVSRDGSVEVFYSGTCNGPQGGQLSVMMRSSNRRTDASITAGSLYHTPQKLSAGPSIVRWDITAWKCAAAGPRRV